MLRVPRIVENTGLCNPLGNSPQLPSRPMDHLQGLNPAQREAVINTEGPSMVIAGAGSGKTRVLTHRIAQLMQNGVDPFRILALTFTNKAAREMKERIGKIVGYGEARNLWMGTFHSVFARVLRAEADKLGYPSDFTIYDTADSRNLIKSILKEWQLDDKVYRPNQVHGRISIAKNNLMGPEEYLNHPELMAADASGGRDKLGQIFEAYCERCFRAGAMDFDDLLFNTALLFRDHPDAMLKYQQRFEYVLVDEYQDTNLVQYNIVRTLAARHENICVVGDDSQSIYAFRGANIQNILNFRKDYPDHTLFKLEQNYRSTSNIVEAANTVIAKNKDQIKKKIWTDNGTGEKIKVHRCLSDNEEGLLVANSIFEKRMNGQVPNSDFAILYRTNAQSRSMEEALRKLNIPYRIYGGLSFYQRKEVKDLLAYFRLTANPKDEEALRRVINYPLRGIGKTTVEKLMVLSNQKSMSVWELINEETPALGLNAGTTRKLVEFATMIKSFQTMLETHSAYNIGEHIARSTGLLKELYSDRTPEGISRYDNVQELLSAMKEFSEGDDGEQTPRTLSDFLIDVALLTDADNQDENDNDHVSLMTVHSAKGLEFPYVFIVGMEEELFPNQMAIQSRADLEEERRLFYVALTRAEKQVTLSYAVSRYRWGNLVSCEPSRFIEEIDEQFLDMPKNIDAGLGRGTGERTPPWRSRSGAFGGAQRSRSATRPKVDPSPTIKPAPRKGSLKPVSLQGANAASETVHEGLDVGTEVEHARFGKGKVIALDGSPPNVKATVFFPKAGKKQLLLRFAKLKVLEG